MIENGETRAGLDIILEKKPGFFIRWGLIVFVMTPALLFFVAYYVGYDTLALFSTKH